MRRIVKRVAAAAVAVAIGGIGDRLVADDDPELVKVVVELLADKDKDIRALGLEQVRTQAKGEAATRLFAAELGTLPSDAQVGLLAALADRGDRAARDSVLDLLKSNQD